MKKVLVLIMVTMLLVSGCAKEEESLEEVLEMIQNTRAEIDAAYEESSSDSEFWASAQRAAKLVSETVVDNYKYDIIFILETSNGEYFVVEQLQNANTVNQAWRDLCESQIILELASQERVKDTHDAGGKVRVYSTTLNCPVARDDCGRCSYAL